jgi:hypothetical protein
LARAEQEKNRRRHSPAFTRHAQFFHKHNFCATALNDAEFRGIYEHILTRRATSAQAARSFA